MRNKTDHYSLISNAIAVFALIVAGIALVFSCWNRADMRAIEHLDIVPKLELQAYINHSELGSFISVRNPGPIKADQLIIELLVVKLFIPSKAKTTSTLSDLKWDVGDLSPLSDTTIRFDYSLIQSLLVSNQPMVQRVLVVRLAYRHPSHAKQYFSKAYFFLSPDRKWVGEHASGLDPSIYDPIKSAVIENWSDELFQNIGGATLHTSEESE